MRTTDVRRKENRMGENNEERIVMLTIKEAAAGKKYLINKDLFLRYLRGETA